MPTGFLAGFDGYMRRPARPGCGTAPTPAPAPTAVSVTFAELGMGAGVTTAAVRDVWARADLPDATGGQLTATVGNEDSVFFVLSPK